MKMNNTVMTELKKFDIQLESETLQVTDIFDLLDDEKCVAFLQKQMEEIKAPTLSVAASLFSKRYAYLVVSSTLFSMGKYDCALVLPIQACGLNSERKLCIKADMCHWYRVESMPREQWCAHVIRSLFSNHLTPLFCALQRNARVPSKILWENVAVRINSIYRKTLAKETNLVKRQQLYNDFYFLKEAEGTLFGTEKNPIKDYLKIGEALKSDPYRKTCCLYFRLEEDLEGIGYCANCLIKKRKSSKSSNKNCI